MESPNKRCATCHQQLPLSTFNIRRAVPDGLQDRCRPCSREWYMQNRAQHIANVAIRKALARAENRRRMRAYLEQHPCVDCGESDLRVLEFDHVRGTKSGNVGTMLISPCSWSAIESEIEKCEVRCANCHRRKTFERAGSWRHSAQVF